MNKRIDDIKQAAVTPPTGAWEAIAARLDRQQSRSDKPFQNWVTRLEQMEIKPPASSRERLFDTISEGSHALPSELHAGHGYQPAAAEWPDATMQGPDEISALYLTPAARTAVRRFRWSRLAAAATVALLVAGAYVFTGSKSSEDGSGAAASILTTQEFSGEMVSGIQKGIEATTDQNMFDEYGYSFTYDDEAVTELVDPIENRKLLTVTAAGAEKVNRMAATLFGYQVKKIPPEQWRLISPQFAWIEFSEGREALISKSLASRMQAFQRAANAAQSIEAAALLDQLVKWQTQTDRFFAPESSTDVSDPFDLARFIRQQAGR